VVGGIGKLFTTRIPCRFCGSALANLARFLQLDELHVYGPGGYYGRFIAGQGGYKTIVKGTEWSKWR
jgi:hypothetical protein